MEEVYKEWEKECGQLLKHYPLIKNTWKKARWKIMYKEGISPKDAVSLCILAHTKLF